MGLAQRRTGCCKNFNPESQGNECGEAKIILQNWRRTLGPEKETNISYWVQVDQMLGQGWITCALCTQMRIAYRSMVKQIIVTEALLYQNALQYIKSTCIAMCIVQCTSKQHRAMMIDGGKGKLSFKDVKGWLQSTSVTRFPLFLGTIPPPHLKLPPSWADATFPRMSSVSQCVVALPATCIPLHPPSPA